MNLERHPGLEAFLVRMAEDVRPEISKTLEQFGDRDSDAPGKQLARAQFLQVNHTLHLKYLDSLFCAFGHGRWVRT